MKNWLITFLLLPFFADAQYSLKVCVKNEQTKEIIPGVSVRIKNIPANGITNQEGFAIFNDIPNGKQVIEISSTGYTEIEKIMLFPLIGSDTIIFFVEQEIKDLDEVSISTTRSNRSIKNTPTRVEVIAEEEVHEEATMRPGDIRMLLSESTGIQTQQTSATSANAGIRIQGLDGRYTQILKDGFPVYSGAANGLGLLQTPPLDLKQVEIIKGSSSTLNGGGAIAGLINLITKTPSEKRELNFNVNVTSAGGLDINNFYGQRFKKIGLTLFASVNSNKAYDPAGIFFTAIPEFHRFTINPKLFFYFNDKTTLNFGVNTTFENRVGGDIKFINGTGDSSDRYFERNKTKRVSTQLTFDKKLGEHSAIKIKNSEGWYNRKIFSDDYAFDGTQYSSFTEATYASKLEKADWVAGVNVLTDQFKERAVSTVKFRDYIQTTFGAFIQNTWNASDWITIETGLRGDHIKEYGFALLPRVSALFKITSKLSSRVGGGFGYKAPTIFTEESERLLYKNVLPVNSNDNRSERSYGANWDINYRTSFDKMTFSINQFFFYTILKNPLSLTAQTNGLYSFKNITGNINSRGGETNIKLGYDELALYLGYTYTDARLKNNGITSLNPLTPKHRFNGALVYEVEDKWKVGSEIYYFSKQKLTDGTLGRGYWLTGLVAERLFSKFSIYINFENFGDVRQTKFESIYTGTLSHPVFKDIYAPLEGFVVNGGIKIKL